MRNDVSFPPPDPAGNVPPTSPPSTTPGTVPVTPHVNGRLGSPHPHAADRAHSLEKTSDHAATDAIYDMPEARGGIDSLTLSIVVVAGVAVALLIVAYLFYSRL